ncbi:MAG TPA: YWFCY domain-containing protein, partial [Puia sp.]|nr:YWFCY domain-containing protein [Puia sp.]
MQTNTNKSMRDMAFMSLLISMGLLALHLYFIGYPVFDRLGWSSKLTDRLLFQFSKTGWLDGSRSRMAMLFFLAISVFAGAARRMRAAKGMKVVVLLCVGVAFFWGSSLVPGWAGDAETGFWEYLAALLTGFYLLERGMSEGRLFLKLRFGGSSGFGQGREGFPQERRLIKGEFSLHLPAQYKLQGVVMS